MRLASSVLTAWQRCPRRARLELPRPLGLALVPRDGEAAAALELGTQVHRALEQAHRGEPVEPPTIPLAAGMVGHWLGRWREDPWPGCSVVGVERSFRLPLPGGHELVGTWDLILDSPAGLWAVDHKTFGGSNSLHTWPAPTQAAVERLPQLRLYAWAADWLLGRTAGWGGGGRGGWVWAGLRKALPRAPRTLKSGRLSSDVRSDAITLGSYQAACAALGQAPDPQALRALTMRRATGLEDEHWWPRRWCSSSSATASPEAAVFFSGLLADEITAAPLSPACLPPRYDWRGCPDCAVRPLCDAIERGEDWRALAERDYVEDPEAGSPSMRRREA